MSHQAATALFARRSSFVQGYDHILSHYLVFHLELFPYQGIWYDVSHVAIDRSTPLLRKLIHMKWR